MRFIAIASVSVRLARDRPRGDIAPVRETASRSRSQARPRRAGISAALVLPELEKAAERVAPDSVLRSRPFRVRLVRLPLLVAQPRSLAAGAIVSGSTGGAPPVAPPGVEPDHPASNVFRRRRGRPAHGARSNVRAAKALGADGRRWRDGGAGEVPLDETSGARPMASKICAPAVRRKRSRSPSWRAS